MKQNQPDRARPDTWRGRARSAVRPDRVSARAVAVVTTTAGPLVAVTILGVWGGRAGGRMLALDVAAGLLAWALTPMILWRPVAGAVLLGLLSAMSPAATPPATMGALQVARRRPFPAAVAVGAVGLAAHAVQGAWRANGGMSYGWWLALITLAYGALLGWGAWARAREALIRSLEERARRAEAEQGRRVAEARMLERRRIAREMHDVLAHRLSLLATFAGALEYRPDSPPERLSTAAGIVRSGVHQALEELRDVIALLREDGLDGDPDGVGPHRPQPVLADVPRLVGESREAGTPVLVDERVTDPSEAPPVVARTAYRVVQEGLTNARRHAPGQPVRVEMRGGPGIGLEIDISNPLPSVRPAGEGGTHARPGGAGLVGLTERVGLAGGVLDHGVSAGEFQLRASIPWPA
ncbi:sensor histidine kinase [Actinoplanes sp. G11-F43]|uniref:sensor histidine kinase n=1 Tax=Actinoplanes sp. G11-F43 TaxID=3424130 RepID=UPI003D34853E